MSIKYFHLKWCYCNGDNSLLAVKKIEKEYKAFLPDYLLITCHGIGAGIIKFKPSERSKEPVDVNQCKKAEIWEKNSACAWRLWHLALLSQVEVSRLSRNLSSKSHLILKNDKKSLADEEEEYSSISSNKRLDQSRENNRNKIYVSTSIIYHRNSIESINKMLI